MCGVDMFKQKYRKYLASQKKNLEFEPKITLFFYFLNEYLKRSILITFALTFGIVLFNILFVVERDVDFIFMFVCIIIIDWLFVIYDSLGSQILNKDIICLRNDIENT